jgi:hypothetical protein
VTGLDIDTSTMKMTVTRDDSVAVGGTPKVMDYNATTREFSCAIIVPANSATTARTYTVTITGKDSIGAPIPFTSKLGTFIQSAASSA